MDKKYDVDDILAEVRQKRQQRGAGARQSVSEPMQRPVQTPRPTPPIQTTVPEEALPRFFEPEEPTPRPQSAIPTTKQPLWPADDHDVYGLRPKTTATPPTSNQPLWPVDKVDVDEITPKAAVTPSTSSQPLWPIDKGDVEEIKPKAAAPAAPPAEPSAPSQIRGGFAEKWRMGMENFALPEEESSGLFGRRSKRKAEEKPTKKDVPVSKAKSVFLHDDTEEGSEMGFTRTDLPFAEDAAAGRGVLADRAAAPADEDDYDYDDEDEYEDEEAPLGEDEELFEYTAPSQQEEVWEELHSLKTGLVVRLLVTGLCSALLIYFSLSYKYPLPLPPFMFPERDLGMFFIANLVVFVIAVLLCSNTVGGGLISLFTLKGDNDSLAAAAVLACLIQGGAMVVSPTSYENPGVHLYLPLAALSLFFNTMGKLLIVRRLNAGFGVLTKNPLLYTAQLAGDKDFARELTRGQNLDYPQVAYSVKSGFLTNFLELAHSEDYSDSVSRLLAPVCFGAGLLLAVISMVITKDIFVAITVFAAVLCVASPFTALFVGNLPLAGIARRLKHRGAMVSGYGAVERFGDTNAVVVGCSDLFPPGSITLHGIKVFQKNRIDEAILDAASVICSCDSTLTSIFTEMIGGKLELLKKVESLTYEDGLGLSAWVGGKRVLIGNRDLMKHHGIDIPSKDFEQRYLQGDRELLYLANSGELTAMYILDYGRDDDVDEEMGKLADWDMSLIVYSTDPYVTPERLEKIFDYPAELIKVMPAKLHGEYSRISAKRETARAYLAHNGSLGSFVHTLLELRLARTSVVVGTVLQTAGLVLGFALVTFAAFMQSTASLTWVAILGYQLFWMLATLAFPNLRRV